MVASTRESGVIAPTEVGVFWEGGYYAGKINISSKIYGIVVSPKASGQSSAFLTWQTSSIDNFGTSSLNDGWLNTQAMIAEGIDKYPAAKFCHDLVINGYDDWYLPSADELEICYRSLKPSTNSNTVGATGYPNGANGYNPSSIPIGAAYTTSDPSQTTVDIFKDSGPEAFIGNYYWTSTQINASSAWTQAFHTGRQLVASKSGTTRYTRAIRKVLIG